MSALAWTLVRRARVWHLRRIGSIRTLCGKPALLLTANQPGPARSEVCQGCERMRQFYAIGDLPTR